MLNDAAAAEGPGRDAAKADRFVDVFFEVRVESMFQQAGVTVIVFRRHDDQTIAALPFLGELWDLDLLACIVHRQAESTHIDQFRFHTRALLRFLENKLRGVLAAPTLPWCAENHGKEKWAFCGW